MSLRRKLFLLISAVILCAGFLLSSPSHNRSAESAGLPVGKSSYGFVEQTGVTSDPIRIYAYRSAGWKPGKVIVVVFHGSNRNAKNYRSGWVGPAEDNNLLIICPEFTQAKYPGIRYYNTGNIMDRMSGNGILQPQSRWVFPAIDRIINDIKTRTGAQESPVVVFGHSAGAQMVHRYAIFGGRTDACLIMPANAGWYTMPDTKVSFPYGLGGVPVSREKLVSAFAKPVVVLLGEEDNKRNAKLRTTPKADRQGLNRLARGKNFFKTAKIKAAELGVPFNWKLVTVPKVGHQGAKMANAAVKVINSMFKDKKSGPLSFYNGSVPCFLNSVISFWNFRCTMA